MAFIPVPHCWEVKLSWSLGGSSFPVNIFHIDGTVPGTLTQGQANGIAEIFEGALESSNIQAFQHTGMNLLDVQVTDLSTSTAPQFHGTFDAYAGLDTTDPLPAQTAGMIEWTTALRGRSYRGKTFFAGFCEDGSGGGPTTALVNALDAFGLNIRTGLSGNNIPLVIASKFSGSHLVGPDARGRVRLVPTPRVTGIMTPVVASAAETQFKTQRRRSFPG